VTGARRPTTIVLAAILAACSHAHDTAEPTAGSTTAPAAAGSSGAAVDARPAGPPPPALPRIELGCTADADCAIMNLRIDGEQACCPVCGLTTAGRADWVRAIREVCAARSDWTVRCVPLACPVGVDHAVCKDQRCVTVQ
jgi:hypothetical protein